MGAANTSLVRHQWASSDCMSEKLGSDRRASPRKAVEISGLALCLAALRLNSVDAEVVRLIGSSCKKGLCDEKVHPGVSVGRALVQ